MNIIKNIKLYNDTDVFIGNNNIERLGYDRNETFTDILKIAIDNKCHIIIKSGKGKWYLKGMNKDFISCKNTIENNLNNHIYKKCWLIEYE